MTMPLRIAATFFIIICFYSSVLSQYPNVRVSSVSSATPEEVTIAINPTNPLNLAAGANINFYYYSTDGGYHWTQGNLSSTYGVWGDPVVTYDVNGNLFFAHLSNPPPPGNWIDRIVVQKSTNGGQSWNNGTGIYVNGTKAQDKEWLAVDMTNSPYRNYLYAAWTEFDSYGSYDPADSTRILFSRSTDEGATWSAPVRVSDVGGNCIDEDETVEGAVPAVGPNGEIYTCWSGPLGLMFDKSLDGGLTWGTDIFVTSQPGGWDYAVPGIYRANGLPVTTCDVSNSPHRGTIYIQWTDQRNGTGNTDAFIIKSTDGGETWGSVIRVNDDTTSRHQFFSWMTIDRTTGYLYVCFYDRRATTGEATDFYVAKSTDGGETFENFKVSASSFTPNAGVFFGDYANIAAHNGMVYPIWMRMDGSSLSVWAAIVQDKFKTTFSVNPKWNMVSVPLAVDDFRKSALFPSAESPAYAYDGMYILKDTLAMGAGYWLKFPSGQTVQIEGMQVLADTIDVKEGWNMVGTITNPVPTSAIGSIPSGLLSSEFYRYFGGYLYADTLLPGSAYWVKANAAGNLVLSTPAEAAQDIVVEQEGEREPVFVSSINTLTYELRERSAVTLRLSGREGEHITTFVDEVKNAGTYEIKLNPEQFPKTMYYYWFYVRPVEKKDGEPVVRTGKVKVR